MRRPPWPELVLVAATVPLGIWAGRTARTRSALEATFARYAARVGDLDVADPTKVYVRALPTGRPLEFAWRVRHPAGMFRYLSQDIMGGSMSGSETLTKDRDEVCRISIRERPEEGGFEVAIRGERGRGSNSFGDRELADRLRGHWDQIRVEQAGDPNLVVADPTRPTVLLRLLVPDSMIGPARRAYFRAAGIKGDPGEIYRYTINPGAGGR